MADQVQGISNCTDPANVGNILNYILMNDYDNLTDVSITDRNRYQINSCIENAFSKLSVLLNLNKGYPETIIDAVPQAGDIITNNEDRYVVIEITDKITTWPRISPDNPLLDGLGFKTHPIIRKTFSAVSITRYAKDILHKDPQFKSLFTNEDNRTFPLTELQDHEGLLQIGDLIFLVDPIQLAFNVQNSYQYYPTLRTQGNPKIPNMDQVKNISVTLIFPNEDAINYQLLNLYAMYKRTPFVNIRNKDICAFYKDICFGNEWPNLWLSVALETIQIQSVRGFPNTLQASVTFLPFDPDNVAAGFTALRSISDIKKQQAILYNDDELDRLIKLSQTKMDIQDTSSKEFIKVISKDIKNDPDFRGSLPFRAFYQSLIADRDYVKDEHGNPVPVLNSNGKEMYCSTANYRPIRPENKLYSYASTANQKPITIKYNHLTGDFKKVSKLLSNERLRKQQRLLDELTMTAKTIYTEQELLQSCFSTLYNKDDFFRAINVEFQQNIINWIPNLCAKYDIDLETQENDWPITNFCTWMTNGALNKAGIIDANVAYKAAQAISKQKIVLTTDVLGWLNGITFTGTGDNGAAGTDKQIGEQTFKGVLKKIITWINSNPINGQKFMKLIIALRESLYNEDTTDILKVNPDYDQDPFSVSRLPLAEETIIIDNKKDIVTDWSLVFSNKFVPISLLYANMPYYQHIGSDDPQISLTITSTSEKDTLWEKDIRSSNDLKTKISQLSKDIYESTKVILQTCPELMVYLDCRLKIDIPINHFLSAFGVHNVIFNNSNVSNIQGMPDSWSIGLNLTQANITVEDYHKVESTSDNNDIIKEIAGLLARTEYNDNIGKFVVYNYYNPKLQSDGTRTLADLPTILRYRYIFSQYGQNLIAYTNDCIKNGGSPTFFTSTLPSTTAQAVSSRYKVLNALKNSVRSDYDIDTKATNVLNDIAQSKDIKERLLYILKNLDNIFAIQTGSLEELIKPNYGVIKTFLNNINPEVNVDLPNRLALSIVLLTLGSAIFMAGAAISVPVVLIGAGIVTSASYALPAVVSTAHDLITDKLADGFGGIFNTLQDDFVYSFIMKFSDMILKDPVMKDKIFGKDGENSIMSKTIFDKMKKITELSQVNCYHDFDLPIIKDNEYYLSPDFYLYNEILCDTEKSTYITEALRRYIQTGKLGIMMGLVESTEALKEYDKLLETLDSKDKDNIKTSLNNILLDNFSPDIKIKDAITTLENIQVTVAKAASVNDITQKSSSEIINDWTSNSDNIKLKTQDPTKYQRYLDIVTKMSNLETWTYGGDIWRIDIIKAARMRCLIRILSMYSEIDKLMAKFMGVEGKFQNMGLTQVEIAATNYKDKSSSDYNALQKFNSHIRYVLLNASRLTSKEWETSADKEMTEIKKQFSNGIVNNSVDNYISLPAINTLANTLYTEISNFVRINTFLGEYAQKPGKIDFSQLPSELRIAAIWNRRTVEENARKIKTIKAFWQSEDKKRDTTIRLFPTFKVYFVEEARNFHQEINDFYTHNAVQSIEITSNKNSPSTIAVLRLSNITNALTDRISLLRQQENIEGLAFSAITKPDRIFLGTLDVKPGTEILIKMGYAPFSNQLDTIFQGRIIEMSVGPQIELICQSYSAQLNHQIVAEHWGMLSTVREHGDVASAVLDMVPGLEKLGKLPLFGMGPTAFTGSNFRSFRGKMGDRFLMGNLLGSVSALLTGQDNPRDDNIYLKSGMRADIFEHMTFDWVIYDQSVWDALVELTLYHRNIITTMRPYNDDSLSSLSDLRQTIVIGDKAGYYKCTDSFGLTSLDTKSIDKAVKDWGVICKTISNCNPDRLIDTSHVLGNTPVYNTYGVAMVNTEFTYYLNQSHNPDMTDTWNFFTSKINGLVISAAILNKHSITSASPDLLQATVETITNNKIFVEPWAKLAENILKFAGTPEIKNPNDEVIGSDIFAFVDIIRELKNQFGDANSNIVFDIQPEIYYGVRNKLYNTDESYSQNPQYRLIQKHHLITDASDIISNNVSLNDTFANYINVYYANEPSVKTASLISSMTVDDIQKKLHIWPVKAFGDMSDEDVRPLNSFQKNIDTNWFDTMNSVQQFYLRSKNAKDNKGINSALSNALQNKPFDIDAPNWDLYPSFVIVGVRLLQKEVEKMYQGTIELIGNSSIQPYDILHIQDYTNDIQGVIEVEEVIHTFTPDRGFRTVITPNMITYDRDPIQMQDVGIINQIYDFATHRAAWTLGAGVVGFMATLPAAMSIVGAVGITALLGLPMLYNGTVGNLKRSSKFLYDQMGNILGRDCINFTSLLYHGVPYMAGFEGVDYTNLKTLINHNIAGVEAPLTRYCAYSDPLFANIVTDGHPENYDLITKFKTFLPGWWGAGIAGKP